MPILALFAPQKIHTTMGEAFKHNLQMLPARRT